MKGSPPKFGLWDPKGQAYPSGDLKSQIRPTKEVFINFFFQKAHLKREYSFPLSIICKLEGVWNFKARINFLHYVIVYSRKANVFSLNTSVCNHNKI